MTNKTWVIPLIIYLYVKYHHQRKSLLALDKEDEEERNKTIESLKTALRTQPMRYCL